MALVLNWVKPRLIDVMGEDWTRVKAEVFADSGTKDAQTTNVQMSRTEKGNNAHMAAFVFGEDLSEVPHDAETDSGFVRAKGFRYLDWWSDESLFPLHA